MKVDLLATVYGLSFGAPAKAWEKDDLGAQLIRSLIVDLGGKTSRNR